LREDGYFIGIYMLDCDLLVERKEKSVASATLSR